MSASTSQHSLSCVPSFPRTPSFMSTTTKAINKDRLKSPWRIAIVGGGSSGLTLARTLAVKGIASTIYDAEEGDNAR